MNVLCDRDWMACFYWVGNAGVKVVKSDLDLALCTHSVVGAWCLNDRVRILSVKYMKLFSGLLNISRLKHYTLIYHLQRYLIGTLQYLNKFERVEMLWLFFQIHSFVSRLSAWVVCIDCSCPKKFLCCNNSLNK